MPMDGLFVHYLVAEFNDKISKSKINKIYQPNPLEIVLQLRINNQTNQLLISASLDAPRIYLSKQQFENPLVPLNFCMILRKYIERGIISNIEQFQNDRIIIFKINTFNEMGDNVDYKLIFELMGRNSNLILINDENLIIDAIRKVNPSDATRIIIPKAHYTYPEQDLINPFLFENHLVLDQIQGISNLVKKEILTHFNGNFESFIKQKFHPNIFLREQKQDFYCLELPSFSPTIIFSSLSEMLEYYFQCYKKTINTSNVNLLRQVKRLINHQENKLQNLQTDYTNALDNLKYKEIGIILQSNLYLVKKGMTEITLLDYLHNNEEITITLNPELDPSKNLKQIFLRGRKANNAINFLQEQINKTNEELSYLNDLLTMIEFATSSEIEEIKEDLLQNCEQYKYRGKSNFKKNKKFNIQHFSYENIVIYVGKNNLQNDYLTNKLARNNDYWFHIKDGSGAHVVVSVPNNNPNYHLSEKIIRLASGLAAYYSRYSKSSSVPVDYTKVQYIKKIPGIKGYHVTYSHQKTIYIDPDFEQLMPFLRK